MTQLEIVWKAVEELLVSARLEEDAINTAESMMRTRAILVSLIALEQYRKAHLLDPQSLSDLVRRVAADKGYLRSDSADADELGRDTRTARAEIPLEERIDLRLSVLTSYAMNFQPDRSDTQAVLIEMVDPHFERLFAGLPKGHVTERIPHIVPYKQRPGNG